MIPEVPIGSDRNYGDNTRAIDDHDVPIRAVRGGGALYDQYDPRKIKTQLGDAAHGCLLGALGTLEQEELASLFVELAREHEKYVGIVIDESRLKSSPISDMLEAGYLLHTEVRNSHVSRLDGGKRVSVTNIISPTGKLLETLISAQKERERHEK